MLSRRTANSKRLAIWRAIRTILVGEEGTSGAALLEFTLFAPLLVIMSIYTMDFGLFFFNKIEIQNAAQAGAHWALANGIYNSGDIQTAAKNATPLPASQITVTSNQFCGCSEDSNGNAIVTPATPSSLTCTASSTCAKGILGTYVTVNAKPTTPYNSFVPFGLFATSPIVSASATVRIQ
jgi:Flp pilus assembly protein TadG